MPFPGLSNAVILPSDVLVNLTCGKRVDFLLVDVKVIYIVINGLKKDHLASEMIPF
jgi:hypothetical protein